MNLPEHNEEKYSIDEMMDRLNQLHEAKPELVTRADGTQALKVKKRKRRTDQPAKRENEFKKRVQIIQIVGGVTLLALALLTFGIGMLYVNSAGYRDSLTTKLEKSSGAAASMEQFRMNPLAAKARAAKLEWPAGNVLDKMEITNVMARISLPTFLGMSFGGEEIVAKSGKLFLKAADKSKSVRHVTGPEGKLPVRFSRYAVSSLDINFGELGGLTKTESSLLPSSVAGQAEMRFNGGILQLIGWPSMNLERGYIKVRNSELLIENMRFYLPGSKRQSSDGYIEFSGAVSPIGTTGTQTLPAKLENFPLSELLGSDLAYFFVGRVNSAKMPNSNFLNLNFDSSENTNLEMTVTRTMESQINLSGFKFLQMIAVAFNNHWYEVPNFDGEATMVVKRTGLNTNVSNINLEKRGTMVVRGGISNGEGGAIKGKLKIGIPESTVNASADKKIVKMFGSVSEGYRWVELEISGTGAMPEDNFRTIYMDTSSGEISAPGQATPKDSFDSLIGE